MEKVGNPLQTKQVNRPSFRDQEGRRGSDEVVPGTSVFPSSATRMSGNFWGIIKGAKYHFALEDREGWGVGEAHSRKEEEGAVLRPQRVTAQESLAWPQGSQ